MLNGIFTYSSSSIWSALYQRWLARPLFQYPRCLESVATTTFVFTLNELIKLLEAFQIARNSAWKTILLYLSLKCDGC